MVATEWRDHGFYKCVIAFGTHIHDDHIGGAKELENQCYRHDIKLMFLMPDIKRQRNQLFSALITLGLEHLKIISKDEALLRLYAEMTFKTNGLGSALDLCYSPRD